MEQPSSGMDTGAAAGEELGAREAAGPDIGVEVSGRWHPSGYGDNYDSSANRWHEDRADQRRRGVAH